MEGNSVQTLLEAVIEATDDAVFVKDLDGRYLLANRAMAELCGCPVDELIGRTVADLFPHQVAQPLMEADREVLESGQPLTVEEHLPVGDEIRIYLARKFPHRDSEGRIVGLLGIGRDITERVQTEQELRQSQERFRQLAGNVEDVFWLGTTGTGDQRQLLYVSPGFERIFGLKAEEVLRSDRVWLEVVHEEDRDRTLYALEEFLHGRGDYDVEYRIVRPDGQIRWIWSKAFLIRNEKGEIYRTGGIARDVTERKQMEEDLKLSLERKQYLADVIRNASVAIGVGYPDGRLGMLNKAARELLGYGDEEPVEADWDQALTPPGWCELEAAKLQELHRTGKPLRYEKEYIRRDGSRVPVELVVHPQLDAAGAVESYVAFATDLSERRQAEKALQERARELNCLYGISALVERPGVSLTEILQGTADLIPPSWQYPEITAARISLEDREFRTANFQEGCPWQQAADLVVHGQRRGRVEVCYLEERPERDEGPFLAEERSLLHAVAERLGRVVERLRAERELQESEARLQVLTASTPTYIYELDASGTIQFANRTYAGLAREQVVGTNLLDWFPEAQRPGIQALLERTFASGQPQATEYTIPDPQGELRSYAAEILPVLAGDRVTTAVLTATDISERVRVEEALQEAHSDLEIRIQERTAALVEINTLLEQEVVQRQQAESALQQRAEELAALHAVGHRVSGSLSLEEVVRAALASIAEAAAPDLALLYLRLGEELHLQGVHAVEDRHQSVGPEVKRVGECLCGLAVSEGQPFYSRDIALDPLCTLQECKQAGMASFAALPLLQGAKVFGVLGLASMSERVFAEQATVLEALAGKIAIGLQNALLHQQVLLQAADLEQQVTERRQAQGQLAAKAGELARSNAFLSALNLVATRLQSAAELDGILEALGEELWTLGLVSMVALLEADDSALVIHHVSAPLDALVEAETLAGMQLLGQQLRRDLWPASETLEGGHAACVPDPRAVMADLLPHLSRTQLERVARRAGISADHRAICLPLAYEDRVLGILMVTGADLQEGDVAALSVFASQVAAAFDRVRLTQEAAETEILREVDRLRSELIANVSHEIRTPLGLIEILSTSLLMEDVELDTETQRRFLGGIREETDRLTIIVDNLLNLSRIESGRYRLDRHLVDLGQLTSEVLATLEIQVVDHRLEHDFPPAPLVAGVDRKQIEQVLRNLLSNAIHYSPRGGAITVQGYRAAGRAVLSVRDEGIGIPAEEQERIFERFYRVDTELASKVSGVGLGLAVCQGIVEAHGGQIWVESDPGQGSRFYFTLPL